MKNEGLFDHTDLVVFSKLEPPLMLLSSPFAERPLGKPLPNIQHTCTCSQQAPVTGTGSCSSLEVSAGHRRKKWIVSHDASDGRDVSSLTIDVSCSNCGRNWRLPCHGLHGRIRYMDGRFGVELSLHSKCPL